MIRHAIPSHIAATITIAEPPEPRDAHAIKPFFTVDDLAAAAREAVACGGRVVVATEPPSR